MDIKNILILGAGNPGAIEHFYRKGFQKWGIEVNTFVIADQYYVAINRNILNKIINKISADFFYKSINEQLLAFIRYKKFDVILVFKGMELFPDTVQLLKEHAVILANYNGDHPFTYYTPGAGNKNVLNSIPYYDVHFSYARSIVEQLKSRFGKKTFRVPFGFDSNAAFKATAPSAIFQDRFIFVGAYDDQRAGYLDKLKVDSLDIYGDSKWKSRNILRPYVRNAYKNRPLYEQEYIEAIHASSGIINLLREQNIKSDSHNMRSFEVPGYGGLLLTQRTNEQLEFFEEDKEAVYFDTMDELKEKINYLASNKGMVDTIKQAAYNRSIRSGYSYEQRSKLLLTCLEEDF